MKKSLTLFWRFEIKGLVLTLFLILSMVSCKTSEKSTQTNDKEDKRTSASEKELLQIKKNIVNYDTERDERKIIGAISSLKMNIKKIKQKDEYIETMYYLGVLYQIINDEKNAMEFYIKVLEQNRNFEPALTNLSQIYIKQGNFENAVKILKKYYKRLDDRRVYNEVDFKLNYTLAWALSGMGKQKDAENILLNLLKVNAVDPSVYLLLHDVYLSLDMKEMGKYTLESGLRDFPSDVKLVYAMSAFEKNDSEERIKFLKEAVEIDKFFYPARVDLFNELINATKCSEAEKYVLEDEVQNPYYNMAVGRLYACLKKNRKSEKFFKKVLALEKDNKYALYSLGHLYYTNFKMLGPASKYFRKYVNLAEDKFNEGGLPHKSQVVEYIAVIERELKKIRDRKKKTRKEK